MERVMRASTSADEFFPPDDRELALRGVINTGWSTVAAKHVLKGSQLSPSELQHIEEVLKQADALERLERIRIGLHILKHKQMVESCRGDGKTSCLICGLAMASQKLGLEGVQLCQMCGSVVCQRCKIFSKSTAGEIQILCRLCSDKKELWKRSGSWLTNTMPVISVSEEELLKYQEQQQVSKVSTLGRSRDTLPQEFMNPFKLEAEDSDEEEDDRLQSSSYVSGSQSQSDFNRQSSEHIPCPPELRSQFCATIGKQVTPQKTLTPNVPHTLPNQASLDDSATSTQSRSSTEGSPTISPSREISRKGAMSRKDKARMEKSRQHTKTWLKNKSAGSSDSDGIIEYASPSLISKESSISKDSPVPIVPEIKLRRPSNHESHRETIQDSAPSSITTSEEASEVQMPHMPATHHQVITENKNNKPSVSPVPKSRQDLRRQPEIELTSQAFSEFKKVSMSPKQNVHKQSSPSIAKENTSEISDYSRVDSKSGVRDTSPIAKPFSQSPPRVQAPFSPERNPFDNEFKKVFVSPHSRDVSSRERPPTDMPSAYSPKQSPPRSQIDSKDTSTPREYSANSVKNHFSAYATDSVERFESRTLATSKDRPILPEKLSLSSEDSSSASMKAEPISVSNDLFSQSGASTESINKPSKPVPRSRQNATNREIQSPAISTVVPVSTGKDSSPPQQVKPIPRSRNARPNDHTPPARRVLPQNPKRSSLDSPTHSPVHRQSPIRSVSQPLGDGSAEKQKKTSTGQSASNKTAIEFQTVTAIPSQHSAEYSASFQQIPEKQQGKESNEDEIDFSAIRKKSLRRIKKKPISDPDSSSSFSQPEDFDGSPQLRSRSRPIQSISRPRVDSGLKEDDLDTKFPSQSRSRSSAVSGMQRPKRFQKSTSPLPNGKK